jgi:hypothetical protein
LRHGCPFFGRLIRDLQGIHDASRRERSMISRRSDTEVMTVTLKDVDNRNLWSVRD